jgi:hypothetical protein
VRQMRAQRQGAHGGLWKKVLRRLPRLVSRD